MKKYPIDCISDVKLDFKCRMSGYIGSKWDLGSGCVEHGVQMISWEKMIQVLVLW